MANSVDFYLAKEFDRKAAEYFASGRKTITAVHANNDYTLTISFGGEKRLYNMRPLLKKGTVFEPFLERSSPSPAKVFWRISAFCSTAMCSTGISKEIYLKISLSACMSMMIIA